MSEKGTSRSLRLANLLDIRVLRALFRTARAARLTAGAALAGSLAFAACASTSTVGRPIASVASSKEAAIAFAPIRDGWSPSAKDRAQIEPALVDFVARFPNDGLAPLARTYLVFSLIDMGDLKEAEFQLARLNASDLLPGSTSDLAEIARAKLLRLHGQSGPAFERIRALVGKLVDPVARALLNEEVSLAAIEAKREYEAIAYMDAWLRNASEEDHEAVKDEVTRALAKEPDAVLENALRAMRSGGAASGYGREIQRLVTERLAQVALAKNDSELARWLVAGDANAPLLGDSEGALGELATTKRGLTNIAGRTIGLVLPTGSTDLRDEAAALMRGVAWALELPREDPSKGDGSKLVTRDDGGDANRVEPTMADLAGEGAAVILAALDPVSAERAARWGEANAIPVIVLAMPKQARAGGPDAGQPPIAGQDAGAGLRHDWSFVAGVPREDEIAALGEELVSRGIVKIAPIVEAARQGSPSTPAGGSDAVSVLAKGSVELQPNVPCDTAAAQSGEAHFPFDEFKQSRVRAWLVDAPSECARDLLHGLGAAGLGGTVALTLDAAGTTARAPGVVELTVRAGQIPFVTGSPDAIPDLDARAWTTREGAPPNWWAALGHDAAALARRAVAALPLDASGDAKEVAKRRAAARDALLTAQAHLWTSDATGFTPAHVVARELKVVELPPAAARSANVAP